MDETEPPKPRPFERVRAGTHAWAKAVASSKVWPQVNVWAKRATHPKLWGRVGVVGAALVAAFLFFVAGIALRLMMGPISLGPFASSIEDSVNRALSGLVVRFDKAQLEWSSSEGKINLVIEGTRLYDLEGRIIAQAPQANLDFDQFSLLTGRPQLTRFALTGIQLTALRTQAGVLRLGFVPEDSKSDLLEAIRKTLLQNSGGGSSLDRFEIINARLAYRDEPTGLFLVSPSASLIIANRNSRIFAAMKANVEVSGSAAELIVNAELRDNGTPISGRLEVHHLNLSYLARNSRSFAFMRPFEIVSDFTADFTVAPDGALVTSEFLAEGHGVIGPPLSNTGEVRVEGVRIHGTYDGPSSRVVLDHVSVKGGKLRGNGQATVGLVWEGPRVTAFTVATELRDIMLDAPSAFSPPLAIDRVSVNAAFDRKARTIVWQRVAAVGGPMSVEFEGEMDLAGDQSPAIRLNGTAGAIGIRDMLRYWPRSIGSGARTWLDENAPQGRLGPFRFSTNILAGAFANPALPEDALSLSFPMEGGTARYMKGLTPITGVRGQALLTGDTFRARLSQGAVGPLRMTGGEVIVSQLHLVGPPGQIKAHVNGRMADVLALLNMKPLEYPKQFNIDPAATRGDVALDLDFRLPMLDVLDMKDVRLDAKARVKGLVFPIDERRQLEGGEVNFAIDGKSLTAEGTASITSVPVRFKWVEDFTPGPRTTRIDLDGVLDDSARARLGLSQPTWLTGAMHVTGQLYGRRFNFNGATLRVDLHNAALRVPSTTLGKAAGTPANLTATVAFDGKGNTTISGISLAGTAMSASGTMTLDADGNIVSASLPHVRAGPNNDFALTVAEIPGGGSVYRIEGRSFDASQLLARSKPATPASVEEASTRKPFQLDARLGQVTLRDELHLRDVHLSLAFAAGERLAALSLDATGPARGKMTGRFASSGGARTVTLDAEDGSDLIRGLTGFRSLRGGSAGVRITFPADAGPVNGDYRGVVSLRSVTVHDQPFLARLFAIGSLDGPLRLLRGEGIRITKFEAPFIARGKTLTFTGGRASGPSIGFTFDGTIDRQRDTMHMRGTLVPVYGINSFISEVPLIGQLLASREGEGIIGLTYAVRGHVDEPAISVNPLSLVTPGILRRIFEYSSTPRAQVAPKPAPKPPVPPDPAVPETPPPVAPVPPEALPPGGAN